MPSCPPYAPRATCPRTRQLHRHTLVSPRRTTCVVSAAGVAAAVGAIVDVRLVGTPRARARSRASRRRPEPTGRPPAQRPPPPRAASRRGPRARVSSGRPYIGRTSTTGRAGAVSTAAAAVLEPVLDVGVVRAYPPGTEPARAVCRRACMSGGTISEANQDRNQNRNQAGHVRRPRLCVRFGRAFRCRTTMR